MEHKNESTQIVRLISKFRIFEFKWYKQPTASWELKIVYRNQKLQITRLLSNSVKDKPQDSQINSSFKVSKDINIYNILTCWKILEFNWKVFSYGVIFVLKYYSAFVDHLLILFKEFEVLHKVKYLQSSNYSKTFCNYSGYLNPSI